MIEERIPFYLALKATLACLVCLLLDRWLGNPDSVSSAFVAVLCVSPIVLMGIRQAWAQLMGSTLGGIWGTLANLLALPALVGVPFSVCLAIFTAFLLRVSKGYPIAAFTALYLILVPWGSPWETFRVRLLAVLIGALSGFTVNLVISALLYRTIFIKHLRQVRENTFALLRQPAPWRPEIVEPAFALIAALQGEMDTALDELRWRHDQGTYRQIQQMWWCSEHLRYILHQICTLGYMLEEQGLAPATVASFLAWLADPQGLAPGVPDSLAAVRQRILTTLQAMDAGQPLHTILEEA